MRGLAVESDSDYKPHLYLNGEEFPFIKKYDVGDKYEAVVKCEMVMKRDEDGRVSGEFVILDIKPVQKKNKVKLLMGYQS